MDARSVVAAILCALALLQFPNEASAMQEEPRDIDVPAGTLAESINYLARTTRVTIAGAQSGMQQIRTQRINGRMTVAGALRALLAETPYTFIRISKGAYRLVRRRRQTSPPIAAAPREQEREPVVQHVVGPPILVVASKTDATLQTYPGSAMVLPISDVSPTRTGGGVEEILASIPGFTSTHLGPGRNKIFLRGFADSSFNGPSQSTTAIYFDEYRLVYSAPNPDLRSIDLRSIELLEGPQGTLYGAGSIGGTLRIEQNRPDPEAGYAIATAALAAIESGGSSASLSGSINLPINEESAVRIVGYHHDLPGYVDDERRALTNVNKSTVSGWRAGFSTPIDTDTGLRLDFVQQDIDTADGQYANPDLGPYVRSSALAQPFSSDVLLAGATISREWAGIDLVSATNWTRSDLQSRFDLDSVASDGSPRLFEELRTVELINHETRVRGSSEQLRWLAGVSVLRNEDRRTQQIGTELEQATVEELSTGTIELAVFGELNAQLTSNLDFTVGLRFAQSWSDSTVNPDELGDIGPSSQQFRVLPTVALGFQFDDDWYAFAQYREGFRSGGATILGDEGNSPTIQEFGADQVDFFEAGVRGSFESIGLSQVSLSLSYAEWSDIQSDILDGNGFPYTANVGNGEIYSANLSVTAKPTPHSKIEARIFASRSNTVANDLALLGTEGEFPNIPELGIALSASQSLFENEHSTLEIGMDYSFVNESILALQPVLEVDQGNYSLSSAWLNYTHKGNRVSLSVRNILNSSANRFSFGNPFTVLNERQTTPLQPRTYSLVFSREF